MVLLTIQDVCAALNVSHDTVERAYRSGQLKCVRIRRLVRFRKADLNAYVRLLQKKQREKVGVHPKQRIRL